MKRKVYSIFILFFLFSTYSFSESYFSGYAGGKINFGSSETSSFSPQLKLQAFFAGQLNFTPNLWSHLEFSIDTGNFIGQSVFKKSDAVFLIDELSVIGRSSFSNSINYLSFFLGKYDPIGTDIFLQRYFSIEPIASKITESYLGFAGSNLYPLAGIGVADVIRPQTLPIAGGLYLYMNHETDDYYVINTDFRFAGALQYFTWDLAMGVGFPIIDNSDEYEELMIAVEKLYWHSGITALIGNNYTNALFLQGGLYNAGLKKKGNLEITGDDLYFIFEPRFIFENFHMNLSFYSIPQKTMENSIRTLLFVDGNSGTDLNIYSEDVKIGKNLFTIGCHFAVALRDVTILDMFNPSVLNSLKPTESVSANITPYATTDFLGGELHLMAGIRLMGFIQKTPHNILSVDVGYRTKF